MLRQKNKQMSSGGDKHLETPYFPQVGKAPSADSIQDTAFPEPFLIIPAAPAMPF